MSDAGKRLIDAAQEMRAVARLRRELASHIDYGIDLQRIIEDLCAGGPIREPKTSARHHYNMAVKTLAAAPAPTVSGEAICKSCGQQFPIDTGHDCPGLLPVPTRAEVPRPCTCHPDDNPPRPCPRKYALNECRESARALAGEKP